MQKNTLRFPIPSEPPTLDWSLSNDHVSQQIIYQLQEGLTTHDNKFNVRGALAHRWEISKDGKTVTFHLRDAKWSDGVSVRAADFVFSWQRLLNPKHAAEYAYFLYDIENALEYNTAKLQNPDAVGVKALDDKTLQVKLKNPVAFFPHITTHPITFPQRQDIVEAHPKDFTEAKHLRTTGPFILSQWTHDSKLVLEPNPQYYGDKPTLDRVELLVIKEDSTALSLYETGHLDVALRIPPLDFDRVSKWPDYRSVPYLRGYYYGFNITLKPFDNIWVRKAFAHATDRKEIVKVIKGQKIPSISWVPRGMPGHEPDIGLTYDPDTARSCLSKGGYPSGKNFPSVTLMYDTLEMNKMVAENLQFQWKTVLGIQNIDLQPQEWKVYLDTLTRNPPQIFRMGWGGDFPDPHNFLDLFLSNSGNNNTRWKNKRYDDLILAGSVSRNQSERMSKYREAQKLLLQQEAVIIPLFQETFEMVIKPYVENFVIDELEYPHFKTTRIRLTDKTHP
ncbi:MAG: peptide ABC transporter substrate-binding protein [Deltaproteobacteria bacterium]|nr:peptide ABC transporter substrate-binding protein [Deltaproteobacteria bacterium]